MITSDDLHLDYGQWSGAHRGWDSADSFLADTKSLPDGVHSIGGDALPLDLLIINWKMRAARRVLPVFFSAAIGARRGRAAPFFSGAGMAASGGYAAICIADPSLALASDLSLSWYAGSHLHCTQRRIKELLYGLSERLDVELLLIGGSGGGFAAMYFGAELGDRASVLVWNPQTDLLRYYRAAVRSYLTTCFPSRDWTDSAGLNDAAKLLNPSTRNEVVSTYADGSMPRRLVYLQNSADLFHVEHHALPFLAQLAISTQDGRCYRDNSGRLLACFLRWGEGHDAPPKPVLAELISLLSDPNASLDSVCETLYRNQQLSIPGGTYPLHFGALHEPPSLAVRAQADGERVEVGALLTGLPPGSATPRFAFYVMSGEERTHTRWYEEATEASFPVVEGKKPTRVVAFAQDSFGGKLYASASVPQQQQTGMNSNAKVFVFGSCVSRDALSEPAPGLELVRYLARSSLASALRDTPVEPKTDLLRIRSEWQRRMVQFDLRRQLVRDLREIDFDVLLLDLIDERFRLVLVDGEPVTLSNELVGAGFEVGAFDVLEQNDPRRRLMWIDGLTRLMEMVGPGRVVLNRVYWATHCKDGTPLDDSERIASANRQLDDMYAALEQRYQVQTISYPEQLLVADAQHKWGVSPFHYVPEMYQHTILRLAEIASRMNGDAAGVEPERMPKHD